MAAKPNGPGRGGITPLLFDDESEGTLLINPTIKIEERKRKKRTQ